MLQFRHWHNPYTHLPSEDPEAGPPTLLYIQKPRQSKLAFLSFVLRPRLILLICIISILVILLDIRSKTWHGPVYIFDKEVRPAWLDSPRTTKPLILRVAVISHPSEAQRRHLIRDSIFKGVSSKEVQIDYRFFVGIPEKNGSSLIKEETSYDIWQEERRHKDMVILDFHDTYERISEKRYAALKWANSNNSSYDYFMTIDSDTFVRFTALSRRISYKLESQDLNPQKKAIMIGRMKPFRYYWVNAVSDDPEDETLKEDTLISGPKYQYPVGIGYMLSSFLVETLLSTRPSVPHHIHYPYDDVMIGSWVASLENYNHSDAIFRYGKHPWNVFAEVAHPEPLVPSPVNSLVIDDLGWHDYPGRKYGHKFEGSIGWDSVCIHHIKTHEIPMLRYMDEFRGEWENSDV